MFAYDGDDLIEETNSAGAVVARYSLTGNIDEPLAMLRSAATSYYEADGLGSVTSLTNGSGTVANSYTYDSFGELTASTGSVTNPFQYTGRDFDSETSLRYYRARYYDPTTGRFLSEDPVRSSVQPNRNRYVRNNPANRVDTSGMQDNSTEPFHSYHGCTLVGTLRLLLWTSESGKTPTSNWYFVGSYQEGPGFPIPWSIVTCEWTRNYTAELWGHVLLIYRYKCWTDDCLLGYHTYEKDDYSWQLQDLGKTTGHEPPTTTQFTTFGAEDETNDILCVTKPGLRPGGP